MSDLLRSLLQLVVGCAALAVALIWLSGGCGERITPEDRPPEVHEAADPSRIGSVVRQEIARLERASGTVSSTRHATISSKILARIDDIPVRAGDEIIKGALVVRLDSRDLTARLKATREEATAARASLELARSERDRIAGLRESNVASKQQLDQATTHLQVAEAELERVTQKVVNAEVALSYAEIRSPVAGRVIDRLAEPGDTAAPGTPLLRVYDPGSMQLEVPVRESLAMGLSSGQVLRVLIEALDLTLEGWIGEIVPAAQPGARSFLVKVRLPHDPRLYAGMFGRVTIPAGTGHRLVVQSEAVERIGQLEYTTVIASDGQRQRRLVTTGSAAGDLRVEVLSGLAEGERVLLP